MEKPTHKCIHKPYSECHISLPVRLLKVPLKLLYDAFQLNLEHVVIFAVPVLDLLPLSFKVLSEKKGWRRN